MEIELDEADDIVSLLSPPQNDCASLTTIVPESSTWRTSRPYNCARYRDNDIEAAVYGSPVQRQRTRRHVTPADINGDTGFKNTTQLIIAEQRRNDLKLKLLSGVESSRAQLYGREVRQVVFRSVADSEEDWTMRGTSGNSSASCPSCWYSRRKS